LKYFFIWKWVIKNRRKIKKADVVQFHDFTPIIWYLPLIFMKKPKKIAVFHGYDFYGYGSNPNSPIKTKHKLVRKFLSRFCDDYICVGKYLEKYYPLKVRRYYYPGIDFIPKIKRKKERAFFASRISDETHLIDYLKALDYLEKKYKIRIGLDVYGEGLSREKCESFSKKRGLDVKFFGWFPNAQKRFKDYKYAFVVQFGATLNSMISKSIVFAIAPNKFREDISNEILNNGEYGIISKNFKALAEELRKVNTGKKDVKNILKKAFEHAKKNTWEKIVRQTYIASYKDIIKNKGK